MMKTVKWLFDYDDDKDEKKDAQGGDLSDVSDDEEDNDAKQVKDAAVPKVEQTGDSEEPAAENEEEEEGQDDGAQGQPRAGILKDDSESVVLPTARSSKRTSKRLSFGRASNRASSKRVSWLSTHRQKEKEWERKREERKKGVMDQANEKNNSFSRLSLASKANKAIGMLTSAAKAAIPASPSNATAKPASDTSKRSSWRPNFGRSEAKAAPAKSAAKSFTFTGLASIAEDNKVGQAKLEDSNIVGIGSKEDRNLRKAAAKTDKAFKNVGKKVGLQIWRVENKRTENDTPDFGIKAWPKNDYGSFYSGDSYIVLNTYKPKDPLTGKPQNALAFDLHFWLGSESTQDEIGVAAYKTVELDAILDDRAVQHREKQFHESRLFSSYFKEVVYLEGGVASGFRHVEATEYEPRLLMVRHMGKTTKCYQIPCESKYMNQGDSFILDAGLSVFKWVGESSNFFERNRAGLLQHNIVNSRNGKARKYDADDEEFWKIVGSPDNIRTADNPYMVENSVSGNDRLDASTIRLWRISDASGSVKFELEEEGEVKLHKLDSSDVFLVHANIGLWLWVGSNATKQEKSKSMRIADEYIAKEGLPNSMTVTVLSEEAACVNAIFNSLFRP